MTSKYLYFLFSIFLVACARQPSVETEATRIYEEFEYPEIQSTGKVLADFTPASWISCDTIYEDLNQDGKTDALLLLTYSDTVDTYEYPKGVINYQLYEQRILLVLFKNRNGYTRNAYCYKLLNFNGGMSRGGLGIEAKPGILFMFFQTVGNGMYELYYTFEYDKKTFRWILTKVEEDGGNAEYGVKASYNFKNDSLHYHSMHWNNDENDLTWTDYCSDLDTIIKTESYYLDSMEWGDSSPSGYLPVGFFER